MPYENTNNNNNDDDSFVICTDAHHGVGGFDGDDGMIFSCRFLFKSPKNASREHHMRSLRVLFDSMVERVDDAYNSNHTMVRNPQ